MDEAREEARRWIVGYVQSMQSSNPKASVGMESQEMDGTNPEHKDHLGFAGPS